MAAPGHAQERGRPQTPATPSAEPFAAVVRALDGTDHVLLEDGRRVRLQGISLPDTAVRPRGFEAGLRRYLQKAAVGKRLWVFPEKANEPGDASDHTAVLRVTRTGPSINEAALEQGLAVLSCRTPEVAELGRLRVAAARAQKDRAGWFHRAPRRRGPLPYLNGAVLGLHSEQPGWDYHPQLDELAAAGFRHVCLLMSVFLQNVKATEIAMTHKRTVRDSRLVATIRYAHQKGLSVFLLPIVLLIDAGEDDWRGSLKPSDEAAWWRNYDRFLAHYLDIAEATSVEFFSIGSELSSLEQRTEAWRRIIANARGRYRGALTYSANWDHVHVPRFFGQLDLIGMTAYFSLTDKTDPSPAELRRAWRDQGKKLERSVGVLGKPVVFTELGYPSQDGINRDPWNYLMNPERIDLEEQKQCFEAFVAAAPHMRFLRGAYLYDYFDSGGPDDSGYSPRGKPAFDTWKKWAAYSPAKTPR